MDNRVKQIQDVVGNRLTAIIKSTDVWNTMNEKQVAEMQRIISEASGLSFQLGSCSANGILYTEENGLELYINNTSFLKVVKVEDTNEFAVVKTSDPSQWLYKSETMLSLIPKMTEAYNQLTLNNLDFLSKIY